MNKRVVMVLLVVGLAVSYLLLSGEELDDEALIRRAIDDAVAAAEAKDLPGIMAVVSKRFESPTMTRDNLKGILFTQLRRGAWRQVFVRQVRVDLEPGAPTARVHMGAVLTSGDAIKELRDVLPKNAAPYRFELTFVREEDDWLVIEAEYQQIGLESLLGSLK